MQLMTDKPFIVYYYGFRDKYTFCGTRHFKNNVNDNFAIPFLYTDSFFVAGNVVDTLNSK